MLHHYRQCLLKWYSEFTNELMIFPLILTTFSGCTRRGKGLIELLLVQGVFAVERESGMQLIVQFWLAIAI